MNPTCLARHSGLWCIEPRWFNTTWAAIRAGNIRMLDVAEAEQASVPATLTEDGIGFISINGPMMKGASKFGNVDTTQARRAVRAMAGDTNVKAIVLQIDSPGGSLAGLDDLANDVSLAAKTKPVYSQIEDLGASAAYWLASQTEAVYANPTAQIGSIGVYTVVEDSSKAADMEGIKVHVVSSGGMKGALADGTEITTEQLDYLQKSVDRANGFFLDAVKRGRGMSDSKVAKVNTGEMWYAEEAVSLGLIDGVQRMDETVGMIRKELKARASADRAKRQVAVAKAR